MSSSSSSSSSSYSSSSTQDALQRFKDAVNHLSIADVNVILGDLEKYMGKRLFRGIRKLNQCMECRKLVSESEFNEEVEAADENRVDLCDECVRFCKPCQQQYAPSAQYKHEDCLHYAREECTRHTFTDNDECDNCYMSKEDCEHEYEECVCIVCKTRAACQSCDISKAEYKCFHCSNLVCGTCMFKCKTCSERACCRH